MTMLDALVVDPVQEWDALICSSRAGRDVEGHEDCRISSDDAVVPSS